MVGMGGPGLPKQDIAVAPTKDDPAVEARRKKFLAGEQTKRGRNASFLTGSVDGPVDPPPLFHKKLTGV